MARTRLSTTKRQQLWDREVRAAQKAKRGDFPICNLCELSVFPGDAWDESHMPVAKSFGGTKTGIAHRFKCNRPHGAKVVRPALAKSDRARARFTGAYRPRQPMRGGRNDAIYRSVTGEVIDRRTGLPWRGRS